MDGVLGYLLRLHHPIGWAVVYGLYLCQPSAERYGGDSPNDRFGVGGIRVLERGWSGGEGHREMRGSNCRAHLSHSDYNPL